MIFKLNGTFIINFIILKVDNLLQIVVVLYCIIKIRIFM